MTMQMMKMTMLLLAMFLTGLTAGAQEVPRLKALKEKQLSEEIHPEINKKSKWGYVNEKGKFLIKAVFDAAEEFRIVNIEQYDTTSLARVMIAGKWGILQRDGTFLVEPVFDSLDDFKMGISIFRIQDEYGILSYTGDYKANNLQELEKFNSSGIAWYKVDGKWGVIRTDGTDLFPAIYSSKPTEKLSSVLLKTESDGKYGILSVSQERTVLPPECESITLDPRCNKLIVFKQNGLLGCLDENGTVLSSPQYEEIACTRTGDYRRILVKKDGKFGLIDNSGQIVLSPVMETRQDYVLADYLRFWSTYYSYEEPMVFYKDRKYRLADFDDLIYKESDEDHYIKVEGDDWMKLHLNQVLSGTEAIRRWKYNDAFYANFEQGIKEQHLNPDFDRDRVPYIKLNKDMSIDDYELMSIDNLSDPNTAKLVVDGIAFPCGHWLAKLFKSVDSKKIAAFDNQNGTSVLYNWSSISFTFPATIVYRDRLYLVTDMYIDSRHMQRFFTSLSKKGETSFLIQENGRLYDWNNYVNDEFCNLMLVNDTFVITTVTSQMTITTNLYSPTGQVLCSLRDVIATDVFSVDNKICIFGVKDEDVACSYIYVPSTKQTVTNTKIKYDIEDESVRFFKDLFLISNRNTGLLSAIAGQGEVGRTPVMRYMMTEWDGRKIVLVSKNEWENIEDARWSFIPKTVGLNWHIGDVMFSLRSLNEEGIGVYSVKYEDDSGENIRFGFIGFDEPFFTMAAFEDVQEIMKGSVSVKLNGEWVTMTKDQLKPFSNNPRSTTAPAN